MAATNMLPLIPDIQQQIDNIPSITTIDPLGRVYKFDFNSNTFVIEGGKLVELTTDIEKIEQWIHLILLTYQDKFDIYKDTEFYCNIEDFYGKKFLKMKGYYQSELINEIKTALLKHRYIQSVDTFELTHIEKTKWKVSYKVTLIDGVIEKQEVV
ncbi:DUF2634 domain-containing protein [Clostridium autoethanogenum]|uniref:DUF2634 domain-containing protein n=1 Tax=Clostridium autoethanogenum DSM 10061 TaxID=1341692 RepID=A0ABM5NZN7_9CLOT|nr:DUF2634 domain-containing protein [Clostridium autoethanogenum]AGY77995.1 DUF2634 domain-containing protein [Clostridium autoethanogenum DSM 10061]ALU38129.1 Hypothetical protein CLAU_3702 [Clostridium autoethanogenum DSM 10061]OVY50893.1 hypothetical protein WX72_02054 [Clostridium autoethanogenum]